MVTARRKWDDNQIEAEIRQVAESLGRFPNTSDLAGMKRWDLANQIQRRGGFLCWSRRLGIDRQASDSDTGWEGEDAAAERLLRAGFVITRRHGVKCPYDLLLDNVLRVDVKSARLSQYQRSQGWFYRIGKYTQADIILLWQLDTGDFYAIPWFVCPNTNVTISKTGGKYAWFRNNIELIQSMASARQQEMELVGKTSTLERGRQ